MSSERPARVMDRVDPAWDAARVEQSLTGLHRRRARRRATAIVSSVGVLLLGVAGAWSVLRVPTEVAAVAPPLADRVVRLADGSRVVPDDGAQVVVEHVSDRRIAVRVDHGAADVEVVPGLDRRFEVTVGDVTVTVLGTAFRVESLEGGRARVRVTRGHVDVAWAGGHADLVAGDEGVFPTPAAEVASQPVVARADPPPSSATPAPVVRERVAPTAAATHWRELAHASRYDEAYVAMGTEDARPDTASAGVDDLLLAADVARLSGHPAEALPWLETIEHAHASDPRAVLAAFTRGRIMMELGRSTEAAHQLEHVLALEPDGTLAEDALARAALAYAAAGDAASASRLANRYVSAYPAGRWSRRVSAIAGGGSTQ